MSNPTIPISIDDPINKQILAVSEDKIQGFVRDPIPAIAEAAGLDVDLVIERLKAMLEAGTIRRIRQTLITTSLAPGALVAWVVPEDKLQAAFEYLFNEDPFSGHVVIRSTDKATPGSQYRLWTTLKVPVGYSMDRHCEYLMTKTGAEKYLLLPAKKVFTLGVGHVRRRTTEPGARTDEPGAVIDTEIVKLTEREWTILTALKRELTADEIKPNLWADRAAEAGVSFEEFCETAESLNQRQVVGRFSTFLEHVKKLRDGSTVTKYNALFHWAVPAGKEMEAGQEVGRHHIMTHAYWREGGPAFNNVNIMGVAHGTDKDLVLAHKAAIDDHLREAGIDLTYTAVFWGGRSEIKPSEISPIAYRQWCQREGLDPQQMMA
ncbi:Lrp/AsnC family transcriptional regulator [Planctomycetales bacterium ZRK34]|nr:Lrp/AsnC family transcriptional regulator [Planctomycetales bacterium ZRK34]